MQEHNLNMSIGPEPEPIGMFIAEVDSKRPEELHEPKVTVHASIDDLVAANGRGRLSRRLYDAAGLVFESPQVVA